MDLKCESIVKLLYHYGIAAGMRISSASKGLEMQNSLRNHSGNANFYAAPVETAARTLILRKATPQNKSQKAPGSPKRVSGHFESKLQLEMTLPSPPVQIHKMGRARRPPGDPQQRQESHGETRRAQASPGIQPGKGRCSQIRPDTARFRRISLPASRNSRGFRAISLPASCNCR